jgi:hypothetical protein
MEVTSSRRASNASRAKSSLTENIPEPLVDLNSEVCSGTLRPNGPNQNAPYPIPDDHPAWNVASRASAFSAVLPGRGCPRVSAYAWKAAQEKMLCDHQTDDNMARSQAAVDASACWDLPLPPPRPHRETLAGRIDAGPAVPLALFASSSTSGSIPDPAPTAAATVISTGSGPDLPAAFAAAGGGGSGFQLPLCAFESRYATASAAVAAAAAAAGPRSLPPAGVPAPPPPPAYAPDPLPPLPPLLTAARLPLDAPLQRLMLALQPPAAGVAGSWAGEYRSLPGFRAYPGRPGLAGHRGAL